MKKFILTVNNKIIDTSKYDRIAQEKQLDGYIRLYNDNVGCSSVFSIRPSAIKKRS